MLQMEKEMSHSRNSSMPYGRDIVSRDQHSQTNIVVGSCEIKKDMMELLGKRDYPQFKRSQNKEHDQSQMSVIEPLSRRKQALKVTALEKELDDANAEIEEMNMMILKSWDQT